MITYDIETTSTPVTTPTPETSEIDNYSAFHDDIVLLQTINGAVLFTLSLFLIVYILRGLFPHE
jgi:hypothetical protein